MITYLLFVLFGMKLKATSPYHVGIMKIIMCPKLNQPESFWIEALYRVLFLNNNFHNILFN